MQAAAGRPCPTVPGRGGKAVRYVRGMPGSTADDKRRRHAQRPAVHRLARLAAYPRSSGRRRRSGCAAQAARFLRGGAGGGGGGSGRKGKSRQSNGALCAPTLACCLPLPSYTPPKQVHRPNPQNTPALTSERWVVAAGRGPGGEQRKRRYGGTVQPDGAGGAVHGQALGSGGGEGRLGGAT